MLPAATDRLRFRPMSEEDTERVRLLELGGSSSAERWIAWNLQNYTLHGFGLWVIETQTGEFVGDCGLTLQDVEGERLIETGWHVRADSQRRGYATEAAVAVRDAARDAGIERLVALIRPDNIASQRVATKIGMALEREVDKRGPVLVYGMGL